VLCVIVLAALFGWDRNGENKVRGMNYAASDVLV